MLCTCKYCTLIWLRCTIDNAVAPRRYIHTFQSGFDSGLPEVNLQFMQSDGGLTPVDLFSGHKAILSGPAGGWVSISGTCDVRQTTKPHVVMPCQQILW